MAVPEPRVRTFVDASTVPVIPASSRSDSPTSYVATVAQPPMRLSAAPLPASVASVASPQRCAFYGDTSYISPALRSWVECLVDNRVDQAVRLIQDGEMRQLVEHARQETSAASQNASRAVQQADEARRKLENQVRSLAEGQSRLLAIVEGISGDTDRQFSSSSQAKAEALATVERVMSTVNELWLTVEQDGDVVQSRLREHSVAIDDIRRSVAEDFARLRAGWSELQKQSVDVMSKQRQSGDDIATAAASVDATRHELAELARLVQTLDRKLTSWKSEVKVEVLEEVSAVSGVGEGDRLKLDSLHREIGQMAASRIDLESQIERLKVEIATLAKPELETRRRDMQQALSRRLDDVESSCENLRAEMSASLSTRMENLDARVQEAHQSLSRRFDALQVAAAEDVESARLEIKKLGTVVKRVEDRQASLLEEVSGEVRASVISLRDEGASSSSELSKRFTELGSRLEQLEVEQTSARATREMFEYRIREQSAETKQSVDVLQAQVSSLSRELSSEVAEGRERIREELLASQRKLTGEVREARSLFKEEQNAIAALDEQLWLTDQRLGQRIDEILQAQRGNRLAAAMADEAVASMEPIAIAESTGFRPSQAMARRVPCLLEKPAGQGCPRLLPTNTSNTEAAEAFAAHGEGASVYSDGHNGGTSAGHAKRGSLAMAHQAASTHLPSSISVRVAFRIAVLSVCQAAETLAVRGGFALADDPP